VTCDFSPNMIAMAKTRFEESDFSAIPGHKVVFDSDSDYTTSGQTVQLDQILSN